MSTCRDITGYTLSRDYARLVELMPTQSVVCIVNYGTCRDVAQTLYERSLPHNHETFQVSARGHGYIHAQDPFAFIADCEVLNLEFIPPNPVPGL